MAEAAEAKPVVEFTKVRDALFLSLVAPFSSSSVKEKVISLSLSHFFSPSAAIIIFLSKSIICITRGALTFISSLSLSSRNRLVIIDDSIYTGFPEERRGCRGWVQGKRYRQSVQRRR